MEPKRDVRMVWPRATKHVSCLIAIAWPESFRKMNDATDISSSVSCGVQYDRVPGIRGGSMTRHRYHTTSSSE